MAKRGRKPGTKNNPNANYYLCSFCQLHMKTEQQVIKHKTKPVWIELPEGDRLFWGNTCPARPDESYRSKGVLVTIGAV